jgi:phosphate transport system substrate-binding protein
MRILKAALAVSVALAAGSAHAQGRDQIRIVGSSTVYPFSIAVAEQFGRSGGMKTPVVESTGSGGGLKLFCAGVGTAQPDITNASRRIKVSEIETCNKNGVAEIVEVKVGFDGIVLANSKKSERMTLTLEQLFLALAKQVPVDGKLVPNPNKLWSDIDPSLPKRGIEVLGPPPTSGTRDAFVELAMEGGAKKLPLLKAMNEKDEKAFVAAAHAIREDGAYIEAGENDNLIVQKLDANPSAFGIFGYSFLDQNSDSLQGSIVNGVEPTFEKIAAGDYSVSRSLYFYVKKAHVGVVPGIVEYVKEFTSERAAGNEGYLADKGLIPLPDRERASVRAAATAMQPLKLADVASGL